MSKQAITTDTAIDWIIDYESGEMNPEDTLILFQHLVDTGQAWTLQGNYGRSAAAFINHGYIKYNFDHA
jgi:hypothetical protein